MRSRFAPVLLWMLPLLGPACSSEDERQVVTIGQAGAVTVAVTLDPFEIQIRGSDGRTVLTTLPGGGGGAYGAPAAAEDRPTFATRVIEGWDGYQEDVATWARARGARGELRPDGTGEFRLAIAGGQIVLTIAVDGRRVTMDVDAQSASSPFNKTTMAFRLGPEDHFFGLGQRFATFDHRGHSLYSWAEEAGLGGGEGEPPSDRNPSPNGVSMTYFPIPFFHSSAGYAAHVETPTRSELHFGSERPDAFRVAVNATKYRFVVYVGAPVENLERFTADAGRPVVPAPWAFGPRRRVNVMAKVGEELEHELMRRRKIPITTVDDTQHFLPANDTRDLATLQEWTRTLHAWGYKATAYNTPYVSATAPTAAADFAKGKAEGFFLKDAAGEPGLVRFVSGTLQSVAAIDFTNPAADAWFHSLLERHLAAGYDGTMLDFGEYVQRGFKTSDGRRGDEVHNLYPVWSAKSAHAFFEARRPGDYTFYVRSGYSGTAAYAPETWGGDPDVTFDETQGVPAALRGALNLALAGMAYASTDIGGFKCYTEAPRDKEVYLRWVQAGALMPMMHDEDACAHVLGAKTKWALWNDDETIEVYAKMARLHTRLLPYFLVVAREAHERGVPVMRPFVLTSPADPRVRAIDDAYFLGPALVAAPVVRRGQLEKRTFLPKGRYVDLDDMRVYEGERDAVIPAPITKAPVLLASGQLLPMLDASIDTLAPATREEIVTPAKVADRLDVAVALGPGERAALVLADGTELEAVRSGDASTDDLMRVAPEQVATCTRCVSETREGDVDRLRVSSELAQASAMSIGGVRLTARGPTNRTIRWDVLRLR